jgi:hypothetical protein
MPVDDCANTQKIFRHSWKEPGSDRLQYRGLETSTLRVALNIFLVNLGI